MCFQIISNYKLLDLEDGTHSAAIFTNPHSSTFTIVISLLLKGVSVVVYAHRHLDDTAKVIKQIKKNNS